MRTLLLILAAAGAALADDHFPAHLKVFEDARSITLEPGAQAKVYPALEALARTGDVRAVRPLASYLVQTLELETQVLDASRETQREASKAFKRMEVLQKELEHLRLKERAGDHAVGPAIEKREQERAEKERQFDRLRKNVERLDRAQTFLLELREKLTQACARVLAGLEGEKAAAGLTSLQQALDVASPTQGLFLVRILDGSGLPSVEDLLLEFLAHPKADPAVRRAALYALAPRLSRKGAEELLRRWESDPEGEGLHARHVLALAARRPLADLEAARAWAAALEK